LKIADTWKYSIYTIEGTNQIQAELRHETRLEELKAVEIDRSKWNLAKLIELWIQRTFNFFGLWEIRVYWTNAKLVLSSVKVRWWRILQKKAESDK